MVNSKSVDGEGSIVWKRLTERNRTRLIAVNLPWRSRRKPRQAVVLQQFRARTIQIDRVWLLKADGWVIPCSRPQSAISPLPTQVRKGRAHSSIRLAALGLR